MSTNRKMGGSILGPDLSHGIPCSSSIIYVQMSRKSLQKVDAQLIFICCEKDLFRHPKIALHMNHTGASIQTHRCTRTYLSPLAPVVLRLREQKVLFVLLVMFKGSRVKIKKTLLILRRHCFALLCFVLFCLPSATT